MTNSTETSPRTIARIAGVLYLVTIVGGVFAQGFVSERLVVWKSAATTASNILAHTPLYRLAFTVFLIEMSAQIAQTVLFYQLLKNVNRNVALASVVFSLAGCTIKTFSRVFFYAPLFILGGTQGLSVFTGDQLQGLSLLLLRVNDQGAALALAFFGFSTLLDGYLIVKSTFLPRALGVIGLAAGVAWLTYLSPPLGARVFPIAAGLGILGSLATITWLLIFGVHEERWRERARAAATSIWR